MQRIEVLSAFGRQDPVFRAKILGLVQGLRASHVFESFSSDKPCQALLLRLDLTRAIPLSLLAALRLKSNHTQIHLFVPDFEARHEAALASLNDIVKVYLVATPEVKTLLAFKVSGFVHHLSDPIDFGLSTSLRRTHVGPKFDAPLRLAWFGYPESYMKSMRPLEATFEALAASGQAVLSVYTSVTHVGPKPFANVKAYRVDTILNELEQYDAVVLSHQAHDFSINTYFKSENKAVLAINRGLPVIASDTPSYARLLGRFGLNDFLFNSKEALIAAVARLRLAEERNSYLERCQSQITAEYNHANIARQWVKLLERSLH
jgi:glycosyltransferase involved in cell wall biosynthesis